MNGVLDSSQCLTQHNAIVKMVSENMQDVQKQLLALTREIADIKAEFKRFEHSELYTEKSMDNLNHSIDEIKNVFQDAFERVNTRLDKQQYELDEVKSRIDTEEKIRKERLKLFGYIWAAILSISGGFAWLIQQVLPLFEK